MDKELENLLDNYENAIYGKVFPITPSMHQLHLLLDYIANLEQQCKKQKEVIDKVRNIAYEYGQIDGAHHKTWVIDQMIRELLGTEYDNFIKEYEEDGEYTWDIGIAP